MILVFKSQWVLEILNIEIMATRHVNEGIPNTPLIVGFTFNPFIDSNVAYKHKIIYIRNDPS